MVVVMSSEASETDIDAVVDLVRTSGGDAFVSRGVSRTIVGLVGDVEQFGTLNLRGLPGVSDVVRISVPYKLVSRGGRRLAAARRRVQAAQLPVRVPGPGRGRPEDPGRCPVGDAPARRHR